ncbi:MAG: hypothetical protein U1G07_27215 [Verrucomicrobiota bacterium]
MRPIVFMAMLALADPLRGADTTGDRKIDCPQPPSSSWLDEGIGAYAREFQRAGAHTNLTAESLALWGQDPLARARYVEAFRRSDFQAMLNYYKRNYPREPYRGDHSGRRPLRPAGCS